MIASVRGVVLETGLDWVVVEVGGVGMRLFVPPSTISEIVTGPEEVNLSTHLAVRDDALTLYGFTSGTDRDTFETLLGVSGIGPRTALATLSVLTPAELREAIEEADLSTLQRVPGIGKKSAQRMVLELGGKLAAPQEQTKPGQAFAEEVSAALEQLGWSKSVADRTLEKLGDQYVDASSLLRAALQQLGGGRG